MLHIDLPTRTDIEKLAEWHGSPAVSIYLRTTPVTQDTKGDRIALKNLLGQAVAQMEAAGIAKRTIGPLVDGIDALAADDEFWVEQANSLAVLANEAGVRTFRLPNHLTNLVEVSDRFHLKPLIRAVTFPHDAYVLAIGAGGVRLVEVSADLPPHPVKVPGMPRDAGQVLGRSMPVSRAGDSVGAGSGEHASLTRYARAVDRALRPVLSGGERPLILAAPEPMVSVFRQVCSYSHLANEAIVGSAHETPDHELAATARKILDSVYAADIAALAQLYRTREGQGRATADVAQAARAATFGAVDVLLVDMDTVVPGRVDDNGAVVFAETSALSYGVVDEIARRALRAGARVIAARRSDIPGGGDLAAILRYPL
ncbi:MAG TPA: hypothetical protein VGN82_10520 [Bosea sp. (in: a-proteobacteria)]|jgi:hypothetical protein|uniref:baeRF11 domain-containing protein n=1 Tax=Bosea sp. (in: a-proteobacteria) TaxID=1871050 RepID=UPI002E0EC6E7|nr:hypothetical protein [Bosea sp. (in: a-proteobacteria)]